MAKALYMAATNQHVGKTTTTLGMLSSLMKQGIDVGYCKPAGQEHISWHNKLVDKDSFLFAQTMHFDLQPHIHSPVIMGKGFTAKYIDNPNNEELFQQIDTAAKILNERHDMVLYEGTGHPAVGSIIDLSNADVAKFLNAGVIIVMKGGIGSAFDRLTLCKSVFDQAGVPILGVIVNKILPEKIDKVRNYLGQRLAQVGLESFGYIPYDKELDYPLLSTVIKAIKGEVIHYGEPEKTNVLVEGVIAGSLVDLNDLNTEQKYLLVVSARRLLDALRKLDNIFWHQHNIQPNLAGIVLTGTSKVEERAKSFIDRYEIPTIRTHYDTYESIIRISRIEVKLNSNAPNKIVKAQKMIDEHVDIDRICEVIRLG